MSPPRTPGRPDGRRRWARPRPRRAAPYVVMVCTALKPAGELRITPPRLTPVALAARQLARRPRRSRLSELADESLLVALASTAIVVLAATPAAYYTARHRFPGRSAFLFARAGHPDVLADGAGRRTLPRSSSSSGLVNTYAALILTNAAFNLAFAIWILRAFFASIPSRDRGGGGGRRLRPRCGRWCGSCCRSRCRVW